MRAVGAHVPPIDRTAADLSRLRRRLLGWGRRHGRQFPWRSTRDPWEVLLAELLLQRTRADLVAPVYESTLRRYGTAGDLADADPSDVVALLRPLGFAHRNARVQGVADACRDGVPRSMRGLLALPGVGRYAATATLCFAYGRRLAVVDPTVVRLFGRLGIVSSERARARDDDLVWRGADRLVPRHAARAWNFAVLDLGALVCRPRPRCHECPLLAECPTGQRLIVKEK